MRDAQVLPMQILQTTTPLSKLTHYMVAPDVIKKKKQSRSRDTAPQKQEI